MGSHANDHQHFTIPSLEFEESLNFKIKPLRRIIRLKYVKGETMSSYSGISKTQSKMQFSHAIDTWKSIKVFFKQKSNIRD